MKDIDFNKVKYPEFIKRIRLEPKVNFDDIACVAEAREKFRVSIVETTDNLIIDGIKEIAEKEGITYLYLLNKKNIVTALKKQIPTKPIIADEKLNRVARCPHCHHKLGEDRPWVRDYLHCYKCGQALDWGQEE